MHTTLVRKKPVLSSPCLTSFDFLRVPVLLAFGPANTQGMKDTSSGMTTQMLVEGDSNKKEMELEEDEEEEDAEDWALPASTLPGQGAHNGPVLAVPASSVNQISPGNKELPSDSNRVSNIELNTNKAGMEGLDKEKINKIIMEASKGSRYYENQKKREQQTTERINKMMEKLTKLTEAEKQTALKQVDEMVKDLELSRDLSRTIVHLDMDMFYAAVEMRDNPELRDKPMAVGGMGMLSTSNYKARRFGVRAAMPGFIGLKLCPELVLVPTHFDKYRAVSHQVREILSEYDPNFCPMSLDEAYFDLTDYLERRRTMSAEERTYPYRSDDNCVGGESEKKSSDETSGDEKIQERLGDEDGSSSATCVRLQGGGDEDQSLFTSVPTEQRDSSSGKVLGSPAKASPSDRTKSSVLNGNMNSLGDSTSAADQSEGDVEDKVCARTEQRDGKFETFGVTSEEVVREIRFRIEQKTMLTASAGIAPNCMLAKVCSDKNKPNGQYRIPPTRADVMDFIRDLPIRKVSGIGKVTERMLSALGIQTCTDLYNQRALCYLLFSQISYSYFLRVSLGLGSTRVERDGERKSISTERTFKEISVPSELYSKCMELCEALAEDIKEEQIQGKTVTVKLKTVNFEVKSRATSLKTPVSSAEEIFAIARDLIRTEIRACHPQPLRLRLMGVRLSSLQDASKSSKSRQGTLLAMFAKKQNTTPNTTPDTLSSSVSATVKEGSDVSKEEELVLNTEALTSPARVDAAVDYAGTEHMTRIDVAPNTDSSALSSGVCASVNNLEGVEDVLRKEVAKEDKDSAPPLVDVSVNPADSTVSSDTELPPEQTLESANTEVDARKSGSASNVNPSLYNWGDLEPRLPFCEDKSLSETEGSISASDVDKDVFTEQIYHPELLSKSEIFNEENNQRVDQMLKKNTQAKCSECGAKSCSREPEQPKMLTCPICGQERAYSTLEDMNRHLDMCLNRSAIKELLHRDKPQSSSVSQNPRRKSSPKKVQSRKRSLSGSSSISSKKKRSKSAPSKTLFDFFQKR